VAIFFYPCLKVNSRGSPFVVSVHQWALFRLVVERIDLLQSVACSKIELSSQAKKIHESAAIEIEETELLGAYRQGEKPLFA
jgi:hypothetical protein